MGMMDSCITHFNEPWLPASYKSHCYCHWPLAGFDSFYCCKKLCQKINSLLKAK
uniref:Uncharacterized protein n=1 Tax=Rhizophora mucronata TaxID=61149 RepID=A0A2P2J4W0_RHIMU